MRLSLRQLRLVQHVAREGTLTAAARTLHLTQSALSHQLTKLEALLKVPVFLRTGKSMVPTAAGLRILDAADPVLDAMDALQEELARIAQGRSGIIRLTAACYTCYHWLPEVLPAFRTLHPDVEISLVPECAPRAFEALESGEVDLVLSYLPVTPDRPFDAMPLFQDDQVLVVAPDHPLAGRPYVQAEDFATERLLVHYHDPVGSLLYLNVLTPAGIQPARVTEVRLTEGILALVAAGAGVAVVARWAASPEIRAGRVVPVPITKFGLQREWQAVRLRTDRPPRYLDDFRALLRRGPDRLFDEQGRAAERADAGIVLKAVK